MEERTKIKLKNIGERTAFLSAAVPFWAVAQALAPLAASVIAGKELYDAEKRIKRHDYSEKREKGIRKEALKRAVQYWLDVTFLAPTGVFAEGVIAKYKDGTKRLKDFDKLEVEKVRRVEEEKKTAEARAAEKARIAEMNSEKALRESGVAEFLGFIDRFPLTEEVTTYKCPINKLKEFFSKYTAEVVLRDFNDLLKQKDVKTFSEIYDELKERFDNGWLEENKNYFLHKYLMERFEINAQKYFHIVKFGNTYVIDSDGKHAELRLPNFEAEGKDLVLVFPVEQLDSVYGHINDWGIRRKKERETTNKNNVADALRRSMLTQKGM